MKKLTLVLITTFISSMALADFNSECRFAYRESSVDLMQKIGDFQNSKITAQQLSSEKLRISTTVKAIRSACYFAEDAANKECVEGYKKIYAELDSKVNAIAVAVGNQTQVDQNLISTAILKSKIKYFDLKCDYNN